MYLFNTFVLCLSADLRHWLVLSVLNRNPSLVLPIRCSITLVTEILLLQDHAYRTVYLLLFVIERSD